MMFYLIDTINYLLWYQLNGNIGLVYELLVNGDRLVKDLSKSFEAVLEEYDARKATKNTTGASGTGMGTSALSGSTLELAKEQEVQQLSEKAKGKLPHRLSSVYSDNSLFVPTKEWVSLNIHAKSIV
jgi:hypothetical protein